MLPSLTDATNFVAQRIGVNLQIVPLPGKVFVVESSFLIRALVFSFYTHNWRLRIVDGSMNGHRVHISVESFPARSMQFMPCVAFTPGRRITPHCSVHSCAKLCASEPGIKIEHTCSESYVLLVLAPRPTTRRRTEFASPCCVPTCTCRYFGTKFRVVKKDT